MVAENSFDALAEWTVQMVNMWWCMPIENSGHNSLELIDVAIRNYGRIRK